MNELHITFHTVLSRPHVVFTKLLLGYHLFELLVDACLYCRVRVSEATIGFLTPAHGNQHFEYFHAMANVMSIAQSL